MFLLHLLQVVTIIHRDPLGDESLVPENFVLDCLVQVDKQYS